MALLMHLHINNPEPGYGQIDQDPGQIEITDPNQLQVSEGGYHIYDEVYFTEADHDGYWLWNMGDWDYSDPDSINDEPWTKQQIFDYITNQ